MNKNWKLISGFGLMLASAQAAAITDKIKLEQCHLDGIKEQVQCGTLLVPENYQKPQGTQISINFAVLPAIDKSTYKEPLLFLAGGPGQAAVELAAQIRKGFTEVRKTRDIILVDQRGTGKSHPLQCEEAAEQDVYQLIPEDFNEQEVKNCLESFTGDLSQYNSENSVRDFDAVRSALGHKQINIYGGSYGTRAGLVYLRLFPETIRSAVLDSVGPIEVPIGTFGQSAARSFELLLENCANEMSCQQAFPNLRQEFEQVINRLAQSPISLDIPHPRLGNSTPFVVTTSKFISTLRMQLYSMQTRTMVPLIIHQASLGDFAPLAGLISQTEGGQGMYIGLTFNIVCNEDIPKVTPKMLMADSKNSFGKDNSHQGWQVACPLWPSYSVENNFYQAVTTNVPTLILSGNLDPVTPPSNGEKSDATLTNSHHIVSKNNAHIVASTPCAIKIINEFLTTLAPDKLDESCLAEIPEASFMTSLNGSI